MKPKEIAEQIIGSASDVSGEFQEMKSGIEKMIVKIMQKLKGIVGEIPDEDSFLKVVSEIADVAYKAPNPLIEMMDGPAIYFVLKQIDRLLLDRVFGENWYSRLKGLAEAQ